MPSIAGFTYQSFEGVRNTKWAVYTSIAFDKGIPGAQTIFHEAHINLETGLVEFYDNDAPDPKLFWKL